MLNITYAPDDADIAERLKDDLAEANQKFDAYILVVLISHASVRDKSVLKAIDAALANKHRVLPVRLDKTPVPKSIAQLEVVNLTGGYHIGKVLAGLRQVNKPDTHQRNRRFGLFLFGLVALVFVIAMVSLATGFVAPPNDEFATEQALQNAQIEIFVFPTLDPLMPRTTADAEVFPLTVEAANSHNAPLLMMTATALPRNRQATQDSIATAAHLTSTARAEATQQAATSTPDG
jgi:hypothetical protein